MRAARWAYPWRLTTAASGLQGSRNQICPRSRSSVRARGCPSSGQDIASVAGRCAHSHRDAGQRLRAGRIMLSRVRSCALHFQVCPCGVRALRSRFSCRGLGLCTAARPSFTGIPPRGWQGFACSVRHEPMCACFCAVRCFPCLHFARVPFTVSSAPESTSVHYAWDGVCIDILRACAQIVT